jgi:hypothetical protein
LILFEICHGGDAACRKKTSSHRILLQSNSELESEFDGSDGRPNEKHQESARLSTAPVSAQSVRAALFIHSTIMRAAIRSSGRHQGVGLLGALTHQFAEGSDCIRTGVAIEQEPPERDAELAASLLETRKCISATATKITPG